MSEVWAHVSAGTAVLHIRKQCNGPGNGWERAKLLSWHVLLAWVFA